jgi:hypothetical protein
MCTWTRFFVDKVKTSGGESRVFPSDITYFIADVMESLPPLLEKLPQCSFLFDGLEEFNRCKIGIIE